MGSVSKREYKYFDTPDGQDVISKWWYVMKRAGLTTLAVGTCDVMLHSKPKGYLPTLARYGYLSIPIMGTATAFVVVTNLLTNFRNSDDKWNWVAGGMVAGSILGTWKNSAQLGSIAAACFGVMGGVKKYTVQNGIVLIPPFGARMHGGVTAVRHDFSLLPDSHGEWRKRYEN